MWWKEEYGRKCGIRRKASLSAGYQMLSPSGLSKPCLLYCHALLLLLVIFLYIFLAQCNSLGSFLTAAANVQTSPALYSSWQAGPNSFPHHMPGWDFWKSILRQDHCYLNSFSMSAEALRSTCHHPAPHMLTLSPSEHFWWKSLQILKGLQTLPFLGSGRVFTPQVFLWWHPHANTVAQKSVTAEHHSNWQIKHSPLTVLPNSAPRYIYIPPFSPTPVPVRLKTDCNRLTLLL